MHSDAAGMIDIAPASNASAYDINDVGQIAGGGGAGAFRWSPGTGPVPLGTLDGFPFSHGMAVNISGQVAGFAISATGNAERVFRYTDGLGLVGLGGVGETNVVWGMNAQGAFVGEGRPSAGPKRALLYTDQGGLQALNDLIDASPQWFLLTAFDINDAGQIVGYGFDNASQQQRAFRLDPVVPVGPLAHLALSPVRVVGGASAVGWVTLTQPAPAGGASVALASDAPALAAVPPNVQVAQGGRHASFPVATTNPAGFSNVHLTATFAGQSRIAALAIEPAATTAVGPGAGSGPGLRLLPPYPNPVVAEARIRIELARRAEIVLRVLDVQGRLVRAIQLPDRPSGPTDLAWDLRDASGTLVAPGVYQLEVEGQGQRATARIVVLTN
jgi:probable HAF family extracellular repeat protein